MMCKYRDDEIVAQRKIELMKRDKKLVLDGFSQLAYLFLPAILTITGFCICYYTEIRLPFKLIALVVCPALAFWALKAQRKDLRFRKINVSCSARQFKELIRTVQSKFEWEIDYCDQDFLRAYYHFPFIDAPCIITVIREVDQILINCISHPYNSFSSKSSSNLERIEEFTSLLQKNTVTEKKKKSSQKKKKESKSDPYLKSFIVARVSFTTYSSN